VGVAAAGLVAALSAVGRPGLAAGPTAQQALALMPVQQDVDFERPTAEEAARSTISAKRFDKSMGWVVEDPSGLTLRRFLDTNGDNKVDTWCYYKDGLEVYRDIDSNGNGKADQYRWFSTAGTRWGLDTNENGRIDGWKMISPEEVAAEVAAALATRDVDRFARLVLTDAEIKYLALGPTQTKDLSAKVEGLSQKFRDMLAKQPALPSAAKWVQFSGNRPGIVPAGTDGSTRDVRVYENVVAFTGADQEHIQIQIGTLVEVGDAWRVIDLPQVLSGSGPQEVAAGGFFFRAPAAARTPAPAAEGAPSEQMQKVLAELEKIDAAVGQATSVAEQAQWNARRADLLEQAAQQSTRPDDRAMWIRQAADVVSAAAQSGAYPDGSKRLAALLERLAKNPQDKELVAYVRWRQLTAEYGLKLQVANPPFPEIQAWWLKQLEQYAGDYPSSADTADALMQLAVAEEYAGQEEEARRWYGRILRGFPTAPVVAKVNGALRRLDSVGKPIAIQGKDPNGGTVDLASYRGKVVLVQYWASWCEPAKADMPTLKDLLGRYGSSFAVIGVSLDTRQQDLAAYLAENPLPWPQIFEEGGLDSRPATEMGIHTLPTMILVDQEGKVVNRSIQAAELDRELKKIIR